MAETQTFSFRSIVAKSVVTHTVTYILMGLLASALFNYGARLAEPEIATFMRQIDDPLVMAGPLFQPIRGLLFGVVFYLLRESLFEKKTGWLIMWVMLVVVGILSTFGPAPNSIEAMIYTTWSIVGGLFGLPEVLLQALLLSVIVWYWVRHPQQKPVTWVMVGLFVVLMALPALGLLALAAT